MIDLILYEYAWFLRAALLILGLAIVFLVKKKKKFFIISCFSLALVGVAIMMTLPSAIYLESPSQNQNAYLLKYRSKNNDVVFTSFSSKTVKIFQKTNNNNSTLTMKLLNDSFCLLLNWNSSAGEADFFVDKSLPSRVVIPVENKQKLCPNVVHEISFNLDKFNYEFIKDSPTSSKHIYYIMKK